MLGIPPLRRFAWPWRPRDGTGGARLHRSMRPPSSGDARDDAPERLPRRSHSALSLGSRQAIERPPETKATKLLDFAARGAIAAVGTLPWRASTSRLPGRFH